MQITAPLALVLGLIGAKRDRRKGPAIAAVIVGAFFTALTVLPLMLGLVQLFCL